MMLLNFTIFIILSEKYIHSKIYSNILLVEIKIIMLWNVFDATQNVLNTRGI